MATATEKKQGITEPAMGLYEWVADRLSEKMLPIDICKIMVESGYDSAFALNYLSDFASGKVKSLIRDENGINQPAIGLFEWVDFMIKTEQTDQVYSGMINAGYSEEFIKSYLSEFDAGRLQGVADPINGPRLFSTHVDLAVCKQFWNRIIELDKSSNIKLSKTEHKVLFKKPSQGIFFIENFLSDAECDHLVSINRGKTKDSMVVDATTGADRPDPVRTSKGSFHLHREDTVISGIEDRVAELINIPFEHQEGLQILEYQIGKEYKPHHDYFESFHKGHRSITEHGGQRACTLLMYLSDVDDGGETIFPQIGLSFSPKKGAVLLFASQDENGLLLSWSQHGGNPVIKGEKWVATKWVRSGVFVNG